MKELEDTMKDLAWTKQNRSSVKHAPSKGDFQTKWILQNVCEERNSAANVTQEKSAQELKALMDAFLYIEVKTTINTCLLYQLFYRLWQWKCNVLKARWLLVSRKPKTEMSQFRSQQLTALLSTVQETIKEKKKAENAPTWTVFTIAKTGKETYTFLLLAVTNTAINKHIKCPRAIEILSWRISIIRKLIKNRHYIYTTALRLW